VVPDLEDLPPDPTPELLIARGKALLGLRRDAESLECFERALAALPAQNAALLGKSQALLRLGDGHAALSLVDELLARQPDCTEAHGVRALILLVKGRTDEAWDAASLGCLEVENPAARVIRGMVLLDRGDPAGALAEFDQALAVDQVLASIHQGRGRALADLGRTEEALQAYATAADFDPNNAALWVRAGHLLIQMSRFDPALDAFTAALDRDDKNRAALQGKAQCLAVLGRMPDAVAAYTNLLAVAPDADYMRGERFYCQMHCCDWRDFESNRRDIADRVRRGERADIPGSFMTYSDSPAEQLQCARTYAADSCSIDTPPFAAYRNSSAGRIRVAYLSADFGEHATAYLAAGLFEAHDRSKFETYAISFGPADESAMRRRLKRAFDHFHDVRHLTDDRIAALIHELGIDIAVDVKGHTQGARGRILAYRPAPVQVSFLAYPGTLGTDFMDYVVADRQVIPWEARHHYTEQVIYLPGSYQVNESARTAGPRPERGDAGLPESGFVFCCFNSSYKITPAVFDDWMQILRAVPGSVLWLLEASPTAVLNLRAEALARGIDAKRLIFAPWRPYADHLARCALADLFLDTSPCNAHTTASDALWAGVPVLTRPGATFTSRVATSLLHAVGLGQLSVGSREEYQSLAIHIATSPRELASLRQWLGAARDRAALFDSTWYCRQLEAAFEEAAARHRRGQPPTVLELAPVAER
jgi:protein O-GlcNAc transferase